MEIYTEKEAEILIKYYSPKLIGHPISKTLHKSLLITKLEVEQIDKGQTVINCISNYNFDIYTRKLNECVKDLGLESPNDILNNQ